MPPKTAKKITITPGQSNIQLFFQKSATTTKPIAPLLETQANPKPSSPMNDTVSAFIASLSPNERIAHTIAVEKLGTSYDVTRTHGFVRWSQSQRT